MGFEGMEENDLRTKSFRDEDYNNRRVFLRSYPLQWGGDEGEENKQDTVEVSYGGGGGSGDGKKKPIKKLIVTVFEWGEGKILVLRRFKHKIEFYIIACLPVAFKPPTALISA
ncbi:hypothetical protein HYC85_010772 [Camellia sinensis]|uniref:Uncharacterized protein n=1 Tax=Camellia sinensis TaxID=4442 RepID=A0A7J7HLG1_CAMSI|nr:hypothetical protein HYC85_010772 [Camellia sinensis]